MPLVEMTAIIPDRPFDPDVFEREIRRVLEQEVKELYKLYAKIWSSWQHDKPHMAQDVVVGGQDAYGEVYTDSDDLGTKKLEWLDNGTPARTIVSHKGEMRFQVGYRAGTRRGLIGYRGYHRYGAWRRGWVVGTKKKHKIAARDFSSTLVRIREKRFQAAVDAAFDRAVRNF